MASHEQQPPSLYPKIDHPNPNPNPNPQSSSSSKSSMYPTINMSDIVENLFPDNYHNPNPNSAPPSAPPVEVAPVEETLITIPGAIVHLIDKKYSVELAIGDFSVVRLRQGDNVVVVFARVSDELQWPLIKEEAIVKVDDSHYFFSISDTSSDGKVENGDDDLLNYGLSFASKGQEWKLKELDEVFSSFGNFTRQCVSDKVVGVAVTREMTPEEMTVDPVKREEMERNCTAYWTTLAPNVEEYSTTTAKLIASGSAQLIKGILWCGDVTVDRLKWGQEVLRKRLEPAEKKELDKNTLKRIKRFVVLLVF